MSNIKVTQQMVDEATILMRNCIPLQLIAKVYGVHPKSIWDKIPATTRNEFKDFREESSEKKISLLKLLAWVTANSLECAHSMDTGTIIDLKDQLYSHLKINEWELYLDGALAYKKKVERNHFTDGVDTGYRTLVNSLFPQNEFTATSREVIESILIQMHAGETPFPVSLNTKDVREFLNLQIDRLFAPEANSKSYFFDEKFIMFFQQTRLNQLGLRDQAILKSQMGISFESEDILIPPQGISKERIAQLWSEINGKLQKWSKENIFYFQKTIGDWIEIFENQSILRANVAQLEEIRKLFVCAFGNLSEVAKLKGGIPLADFNEIMGPIRKKFPDMRIITMEAMEDDTKLALLNTTLEALEFSMRTYNCLKSQNINTLGQISAWTREECLDINQLGQKSLSEVEQVLHEYNLEFGMDYQDALHRVKRPELKFN